MKQSEYIHSLKYPTNNRKASPVAHACIKQWESLSLSAYLPTKDDVPTIGWGHTKNVEPGQIISVEKAQELFLEDVAEAEETIKGAIPEVELTILQYDAIVSMTFNLGRQLFWNHDGTATGIHRALRDGDHQRVYLHEMPRWVYQAKQELKGLVKRRAFEAGIYLAGTAL